MFGKRKQTLLERLSIAQGYQNLQHDENNHGVQDYSSPFLQNLSNSAIERLQLHMHLQSTLSFSNNLSMFPKLNSTPLEENMIQNIQPMNNDQKFDIIYQQSCVSNNMTFHALEDVHDLSSNSLSDQKATNIVTGHDGFHNGSGENGGFLPSPGDMAVPEFECYQGMEVNSSKDQLLWWASEFDTNSASSNSLDSASHTYQTGEMNQDFIGVGYSNINTTNL
ncbi:hypothetical protein Leryth_002911 [Lithospermum erythrorhizon]|nr:hypothetical protein Leryth_002911 [Lithospermum erythrorhizon]